MPPPPPRGAAGRDIPPPPRPPPPRPPPPRPRCALVVSLRAPSTTTAARTRQSFLNIPGAPDGGEREPNYSGDVVGAGVAGFGGVTAAPGARGLRTMMM